MAIQAKSSWDATGVILVAMLLLVDVSQATTPSKWKTCPGVGNRYIFVNRGLTFDAAAAHCRKAYPGSQLALPLNEKESKCINSTKHPGTNTWIGTKYKNMPGCGSPPGPSKTTCWFPLDSRIQLGYSNWHPLTPNTWGKCGVMWYLPVLSSYGNLWDNHRCNGHRWKFVCQMPPTLATCWVKPIQNGVATIDGVYIQKPTGIVSPQKVSYRCNTGYVLSGSSSATCQQNGTISPTACQAEWKTCFNVSHQYVFVDELKSQSAAVDFCNTSYGGSKLALGLSEAENVCINSTKVAGISTWAGMRRNLTRMPVYSLLQGWYPVGSDKPLSFRNWHTNGLSYRLGDCAAMWYNKNADPPALGDVWLKMECGFQRLKFVCQKPLQQCRVEPLLYGVATTQGIEVNQTTSINVLQVVTYRCSLGAKMLGSNSATCRGDALSPNPPVCKVNWKTCKDVVNRYVFIDKAFDYKLASEHCQDSLSGSTLAVAHSRNDNDCISSAKEEAVNTWIDIRNNLGACGGHPCWRVGSTSNLLSFTNWNTNEPNPQWNHQCAAMFSDRGNPPANGDVWITRDCGNRLKFVCQKPLEKCSVMPLLNGMVKAEGSEINQPASISYLNGVTYSCNTDYTMHGNNSARCQEDGTLSARPPTCQGKYHYCGDVVFIPMNSAIEVTFHEAKQLCVDHHATLPTVLKDSQRSCIQKAVASLPATLGSTVAVWLDAPYPRNQQQVMMSSGLQALHPSTHANVMCQVSRKLDKIHVCNDVTLIMLPPAINGSFQGAKQICKDVNATMPTGSSEMIACVEQFMASGKASHANLWPKAVWFDSPLTHTGFGIEVHATGHSLENAGKSANVVCAIPSRKWVRCTNVGPKYVYVDSKLTYSDAVNFCRTTYATSGGKLALPVSTGENKCIQSTRAQGTTTWIGAQKYSHQWKSVGEEVRLTFTNWASSKPSGNGNTAVMLRNLRTDPDRDVWDNQDGSKKFTFVCQGDDWERCKNVAERYFFEASKMTLENAVKYCKQHDAIVALPLSPDENQCIHSITARRTSTWIGTLKLGHHGFYPYGDLNPYYHYVNKLAYTNWAANQPCCRGDCAKMEYTPQGDKWYQIPCYEKHPVVCQAVKWKSCRNVDRKYVFVPNRMWSTTADKYCKAIYPGATLALPMNHAENECLHGSNALRREIWIGARYSARDGGRGCTVRNPQCWFPLSGRLQKTKLAYSNWEIGHTLHQERASMAWNATTWRSRWGRDKFAFFCQAERSWRTCKNVQQKYTFVEREMNVFDAHNYCKNNYAGARLALPLDASENLCLTTICAAHIWIGARYAASPGSKTSFKQNWHQYVGLDNGLVYANWHKEGPEGHNRRHYAVMQHGGTFSNNDGYTWWNVNGYSKYPFVCQVPQGLQMPNRDGI